MRRAIVWLFHILILLVPFAFSSATDELFEFNKMILVYGISALTLTLWLLRMVREKRVIISRTRFDIFLGLFLIAQLISTFLSIDLHTSLFGYYSRFHGGLLSTLSYLILYFAAVSNIRKAELPTLLRTVLFAGIGSALYAFPEHFGLSPSCVLITGTWGVSCWVQDVQTRVFGTFGQPNWLAAYVLTLLPLLIWWLSERLQHTWPSKNSTLASWIEFLWPFVGLLLMIFTLLYTGSRSGFAGLLLGLGILSFGSVGKWLLSRKDSKKSPQTLRERKWLLAPLVLMLGCGVVFLIQGTPFTPGLGASIVKRSVTSVQAPTISSQSTAETEAPSSGGTVLESGGTDSGEIRKIVWKGAIQVWKRYPFFGSGVETFAYSYYRDRPIEHNYVSEWDFLYNKAHNEYLNYLATTGAFGLGTVLLLMTAFGVFAVQAWLSRKLPVQTSLFAIALLAGYVGLAFSNSLGFSTVAVAVLFFLWPALLEIAVQDPAVADRPELAPKRTKHDDLEITLDGRTVLSGVIVLCGAALIIWIFGMWNNDRLLAYSKRLLNSGQAVAAYQTLDTLTKRAPQQAEYWEQKSAVVSQLAVSAATNELATQSGTLVEDLTAEALHSLDASTQVNPVHVNIWKSKARGYIWLGTLDPLYLHKAIESLQEAEKLAPTDPKIQYNLALLFESVEDSEKAEAAYQKTIALRSVYEQARKSYAEFLTREGRYDDALAQYQFINTELKPGENLFAQEIAGLEASKSADLP